MELIELWTGLFWPLIRLVCFISLGLFIGNLIEALNWTQAVGKLASPLVRFGRLKDISGASFSMAFFSGMAANTMLAEGHAKGQLTDKELVFSNLFNSLPTYFLHLPTMFFATLSIIGWVALVYLGLTLASAILRTVFILLLGRLILPKREQGCVLCILDEKRSTSWRQALKKSWQRFLKRIRKILLITVPIYVFVFLLNEFKVFQHIKEFMADHVGFLSFLSPEALSIVAFQVGAELSAGLATAGAILAVGTLHVREVVLALIVGNVLSSPMRAFRHQFPYYAGIFRPKLAVKLIVHNQALRAASLIVVGAAYFFLT